ncbi:uncharacterized protein LOC126803929 [Argentina anserina]|uniref:uncharacterized protein LOC126803929 n=1 Tax=Argentina anserina TaxID=57926 RepID=UPI00217682C0|nr:uncharacterized protein LOC126803929 [Potentilla anserina]
MAAEQRDYPSSSTTNVVQITNRLLQDLNGLLLQHEKFVLDYDLLEMTEDNGEDLALSGVIQDEVSVPIFQQDRNAVHQLNEDQVFSYHTIISVVECHHNAIFFVDGPGRTGKTYLYRALRASFRSNTHIVLATATSGIAATILPGGRIAHSRFNIPLKVDADVTRSNLSVGGKLMIFGGDFRQVLPVVPKGTMSQHVEASLVNASFWKDVMILRLRLNMRSINDHEFSRERQTVNEDMIQIPPSMVIPWVGEVSINQLVNEVFLDVVCHINDASYMVERAIITSKNSNVDVLKEMIIQRHPGLEQVIYSFDQMEDDTRNLYQQEFLNSIAPSSMPLHQLTIKKGALVMFLRNIDPHMGLCNGKRLTCRGLYNNLIDAEILTREFAGTRVFLPRIALKSPENSGLLFR